jgi:hypothetical protein
MPRNWELEAVARQHESAQRSPELGDYARKNNLVFSEGDPLYKVPIRDRLQPRHHVQSTTNLRLSGRRFVEVLAPPALIPKATELMD